MTTTDLWKKVPPILLSRLLILLLVQYSFIMLLLLYERTMLTIAVTSCTGHIDMGVSINSVHYLELSRISHEILFHNVSALLFD